MHIVIHLDKRNTIERTILGEFTAVEFVSLGFTIILALVAVIFYDRVELSSILLNLGAVILIIFFFNWFSLTSDAKWMRALHTFYIIPLVLYLFKIVEKLSFPIHGQDFDSVLISVDRTLFGTDPTVWLFHHFPIVPVITEILQICYFSYYFLPVIVALELFERRHKHREDDHSSDDLEMLRFVIVYGFLLSYVSYLILPGVGPRFTLHDFSTLEQELPGIWLTHGIRWLINSGENIASTMTNADAMRVVTRDVFPSGHTEMTLLSILLAFRFRVRWRWVVLTLGSGLIFSTVYLRYHYVIDVIGGALLAMIALYTAEPVVKILLEWKKKLLTKSND
ncbi:MAG TPA: phosphatase PAP2 family protein [Candidatus Kapabacteria bacterium]|nr:phosphatase PAP2 family protein [Candidatus Kapabacteria bacterium]